MSGPVATAVGAELVVVLIIFMGAATYVNFDAITAALAGWAQ